MMKKFEIFCWVVIFSVLLFCLIGEFEAKGDVKKGSGSNFSHVFIGTKPVHKITKGTQVVWQATNLPNILSFGVTPTSIDLDTRPSGNVTISWTAAAQSNTQNSNIYLVPQGTQVGQSYVAGSGAGVSETFTTPQPNQTQIYRVVVRNTGGASHRDATVKVTQNAAITNFRRTGFAQHPGIQAGTFIFQATIKGYPQPALSYRFGNGRQGAITARHLTASGTNTWTLSYTIYHTVLSDSLVLTATNSSGSVTATINNISN